MKASLLARACAGLAIIASSSVPVLAQVPTLETQDCWTMPEVRQNVAEAGFENVRQWYGQGEMAYMLGESPRGFEMIVVDRCSKSILDRRLVPERDGRQARGNRRNTTHGW